MSSNNPAGAENQQERLIEFRGWVIGFVDGEGCFSIGFGRQPDRPGRIGYRAGYQVAHEFAVTQGASSVESLYDLAAYFGVGQVVPNKRYDNHREHLYRSSSAGVGISWKESSRSSGDIPCEPRSSRTSRSSRHA